MKKILSLVLATLMMATVLVGCGDKDKGKDNDGKTDAKSEVASELKFTTGSSSGTYYAFGSVLAGQVSKVTDSSVTAIEGKGSQGNIEMLQINGAQLGFCQSDVMSYAYNGTNLFEETGKVDNFSTVAALYMEQVQIVTCNPNIKTVADLKGKNVSIGESGSGVYYNAIDVLKAYGMTEKDIKATYEGFGDSAESLKDGKIDAAFVVAGAPTTAITELSHAKPTYLVSLDEEHVDALCEASPYYSKYTIPKDVYSLDSDTTTVAVSAVIIARDDVSDADVYNFLSGIFDDNNTEEITNVHAKGEELDLDFAAGVKGVPYHPGAVEFFSAKGIDVPAK